MSKNSVRTPHIYTHDTHARTFTQIHQTPNEHNNDKKAKLLIECTAMNLFRFTNLQIYSIMCMRYFRLVKPHRTITPQICITHLCRKKSKTATTTSFCFFFDFTFLSIENRSFNINHCSSEEGVFTIDDKCIYRVCCIILNYSIFLLLSLYILI